MIKFAGFMLPTILMMMSDESAGSGGPTEIEPDQETGFISLEDLAATDTSDIKEVLTRVIAKGVARARIEEVEMTKADAVVGKDQMFRIAFKHKIVAFKPVDKSIDPESLVGRTVTQAFLLFGASLRENMAFVKGQYLKAGIPNTGNPGGVKNQPPGWLDGGVGQEIDLRVTHGKNKTTGQDVAYFDWLSKAESEKAWA